MEELPTSITAITTGSPRYFPLVVDITDIVYKNGIHEEVQLIYVNKCVEFLVYGLTKYRAKNKHATNAARLLLLDNVEKVLSLFVRTYRHIAGPSLTSQSTILQFIHFYILFCMKKEFAEILDQTESTYNLFYNYRIRLRENGLSSEDYPLYALKEQYKPAYDYYRFTLGYGKVKSSRRAFKDAVIELEAKRLNDILLSDLMQDDCSICWERCCEDYTVTPCFHIFHKRCLASWHKTCYMSHFTFTCPMCKKQI
jgi:hypothetical protein